MTGVATDVRSARVSRAIGRAPRVALIAAAALLSLAGLRAAVAGPPPPRPAAAQSARGDLAVEAFAERFARAYLTSDPAVPEARERALEAMAPGMGEQGFDSAPGRRTIGVRWTAVVADRPEAGDQVVTVAAETSDGTIYLAVPIRRDKRGFLSITGPPAFVGAPPAAKSSLNASGERDVEDRPLAAVAERVVRNYLAGERRDLAADLTPNAVVSLPGKALSFTSVERTFWIARPRLVAVDVRADDRQTGAQHTLRYRLAVVRRAGRWQVLSIGDRPVQPSGGTP